ncbi:LOW QUALITY PROTEIN: organic solute transporter subunit alpha-like [Amphiura filiformis]|uniref:LOW QUALITY PROTEIN: organic solute transporter subunit alpha-like n=1 Tax=Amphiura filiformis TaxID=82378 RepID=UPI003B222E3A
MDLYQAGRRPARMADWQIRGGGGSLLYHPRYAPLRLNPYDHGYIEMSQLSAPQGKYLLSQSNDQANLQVNPTEKRIMEPGDNCTTADPTSEQLYTELRNNIAALLTLICVTIVALSTIAMFLEAVFYVNKKIPSSRRRIRLIVIMGIYPVQTMTSLLALYVPRAHLMNTLAASVYFSVALFQFLMLIIDYYGGKYAVVELLTDKKVSLANPPLTCCCVCLPTFTMTMRNLSWVKRCVMQVAFIRPASLFIALVLWTDGKYQPGQVSFSEAYIYLNLISIGSGLLALWGISLMLKASAEPLSEFQIRPKFYLVQMVLILISAQNLILSLMVSGGAIPCIPPFRSDARANYISDLLIIVEMFFFSILSRLYFRTRIGNMDKVPPVRSAERIAHHRHFSITLEENISDEVIGATNIATTTVSPTIERKEQEVQTTKETILKMDHVNHNHVGPPVGIPVQTNNTGSSVQTDNPGPAVKTDNPGPAVKIDNPGPSVKTDNPGPSVHKAHAGPPVQKKKTRFAPDHQVNVVPAGVGVVRY